MENSIVDQLKEYAKMFLISIVVIFISYQCALTFNKYYPLSEMTKNLIEYLGYSFWGIALTELKRPTWGRKTTTEVLYGWLQPFFL